MTGTPAAHPSLPVTAILLSALSVCWNQRRVLFRTLAGVTVLLVGIDILVERYYEAMGTLSHLAYTVVDMALITLFAVNCHRIILLGENAVPRFGLRDWTSRESRFLGWTVVTYFYFSFISLLFLLPAIPVFTTIDAADGSQFGWLLLLLLLPAAYWFSRLCILLPATAVDERHDMGWAWSITRGNGLRLTALACGFPLIVALVTGLLPTTHAVLNVLLSVIAYALLVVEIALLSVAFKFLSGFRPAALPDTTQAS